MFKRKRRFSRAGKAALSALLPLHLLAFFSSALAAAPADTVRIKKIAFRGNRTSEALLRRRLPFSEGDALGEGTLSEARTALWDMHQFKKVEVSSCAASGGGAEIDIDLEDGWFLLPLPFLSGGSGGRRGGLMLFSRNIFRQAESTMASVFSGPGGSSFLLSAQREGWSLGSVVTGRSVIERRYTDGAFSASSGFGSPPDEKDPSRYGTVAYSYRKRSDSAAFFLGLPLTRGRRAAGATFGWERLDLDYSDPSPFKPGDSGAQGQAFATLRYGRERGGASEGVGAIFGFGLADLERRLAPLPAPVFDAGAEVTYRRGAAWTGSDFNYGCLQARWDGTLTWGTHRSLTLKLAGGAGTGLPPNRLLATGRETALTGGYAREFRGATAAGAGLVYSHPFRMTRRGVWQGALFAETARAWGSPGGGTKAGAGASFWYKFWRFPLPLGFSTTYSFDDRDFQVSAALGGRF